MTKREWLWRLIRSLLDGQVSIITFCNDFTRIYNLEIVYDELTEEEHLAFGELCTIAGRFSEFEEDFAKYPGVYYSEAEVRKQAKKVLLQFPNAEEYCIKNRIQRVAAIQAEKLLHRYVAKIDGAKIQTKHDYFAAMEKALGLPLCCGNWDAYDDWMTDLGWIPNGKIAVIFYHYAAMLQNDPQAKELVLDLFQTSILPFWEEEVRHVVVGGESKDFQVYLVD